MINVQESTNYIVLKTKIKNEDSLEATLKEAYQLLEWAEKTGNKALYQKFKKEYDDVYRSIQQAISDQKGVSQIERDIIRSELRDILKLSHENGVKEYENFFWKVGSRFSNDRDAMKEVKLDALNIKRKSLSEKWTYDEVLLALKETHNMKGYPCLVNAKENTIESILTPKERNIFQEKLIEKILWVWNKGFRKGTDHLVGYDSVRWNYFTNVTTLAWSIKSCKTEAQFQNINSKELESYLHFLKANNRLNAQSLVNIFGKENATNLLKFLNNKKSFWEKMEGIWSDVETALSEVGLVVKQTINKIASVFEKLFEETKHVKNTKELVQVLKKSQQLPPEDQKKYMALLVKEFQEQNSQLRNMIIGPLLDKKMSLKEANAVADSFIWQLQKNLTPDKLNVAYQLIEQFNQKYKVEVSTKKFMYQSLEQEKAKLKILIAQLEKDIATLQKKQESWNISPEEQKKLEKKCQQIKWLKIKFDGVHITKKINQTLSVQQIQDISHKKTTIESALEEHPELQSEMEHYQKEKKSFEKKYQTSYESVVDETEKQNFAQIIRENDKNITKEKTASKEKNKKNNSENATISEAKIHTESSSPQTLLYKNGESLTYKTQANSVEIVGTKWNIQISHEEFDIIKSNPKAKENLFEFQNILKELNLEEVGKWRKDIFQSLSNKYPITFDMKDDFLNARELKIFLATVMRAVGVEIDANLPINDMKKKIHTMNKEWAIFKNTQVSHLWGIIESHFQKTFIKNGTFQSYLFQEKI